MTKKENEKITIEEKIKIISNQIVVLGIYISKNIYKDTHSTLILNSIDIINKLSNELMLLEKEIEIKKQNG